MISIIICSRYKETTKNLKENIDSTIGLPYEIIHINNYQNTYSIFSAYNSGAAKAKYEILCFMHDDVLFHTLNWGIILSELLISKTTGVIGVAGSSVKSEIPSPWWISNYKNFAPQWLSYNLIQHFRSGIKNMTTFDNDNPLKTTEVVITDGVFMCCRKDVWYNIRFDEANYNGFHFYDIDFSMAVHRSGYKNYVTSEILLEHLSAGSLDKKWIDAAFIFHKKWRTALPVYIENISKEETKKINLEALKNWLLILLEHKYSSASWYRYWFFFLLAKPFSKDSYSLLYHKFFVK